MNGTVKLYVLAPGFLVAMLSLLLVCGAWRIRRTGELRDFGKEETLPLRALLALFVIVGHLDKDTKYALPFFGVIHWSTPAVAVFFFMSGFGLRKVYEGLLEKGGLGRYLVRFPWRTAVRLLPPFLILGPVYAIWKCGVGKITPGELVSMAMNLSILGIPHDWYVIALVILYAVFVVSAACFQQRGVSMAIWILSLVFWCVACVVFGDSGSSRVWHLTTLSFPIGFTFAQYERQIRSALLARPFLVVLSVSAVEVAFLLLSLFKGVPYIRCFREPYLCAVGPMCALVLYAFDELKRVKVLSFLGLFSYEIYLVHGIFEKMFLHAGMAGLPYVVAVFAASISAAWLLWKVDSFVAKVIAGGGRDTVPRGAIPEVRR